MPKKTRYRPLHKPFPRAEKPNIERQTHPSGRGTGVPAWAPGKYQYNYPTVPQPVPMSGQSGAPSSEFSMMASRFMQNSTMNQDDIEYFAQIHDDPPYAGTTRQGVYQTMPVTSNFSNQHGAMTLEDPPDDSWRDVKSDERSLDERLLREFFRMLLVESHVDYISVRLNSESRDALRRMFPPVHENIAADHVTLIHSPSREDLELFHEGEPVMMRVVGYAEDDVGQAVAVVLPRDIQDLVSNPVPHVTISVAQRAPMSYSNELLSGRLQKTPAIVLYGRVSFETHS